MRAFRAAQLPYPDGRTPYVTAIAPIRAASHQVVMRLRESKAAM